MPFDREQPVTPVSILRTEYHIIHQEGDDLMLGPEIKAIRFRVYVKRSDGTIVMRDGDLWPLMTAAERTNLLAFDQKYWDKAEVEFLPP